MNRENLQFVCALLVFLALILYFLLPSYDSERVKFVVAVYTISMVVFMSGLTFAPLREDERLRAWQHQENATYRQMAKAVQAENIVAGTDRPPTVRAGAQPPLGG